MKKLTPHVGPTGYATVKLSANGKNRAAPIHRLVARAFGICEVGEMVNHIDGNKMNPALDNLEKSDHSHNLAHAYATGLRSRNATPPDPVYHGLLRANENFLKENFELRQKLDAQEKEIERWSKEWSKMSDKYLQASSTIAKLREGLQFYANENTWRNKECDELIREGGFFPYDLTECPIAADQGKTARDLLANQETK
jgi:hypothetical protein